MFRLCSRFESITSHGHFVHLQAACTATAIPRHKGPGCEGVFEPSSARRQQVLDTRLIQEDGRSYLYQVSLGQNQGRVISKS